MEFSYTEQILRLTNLLSDYNALFLSHHIDNEAWPELTSEHLQSMGITNKHHIELILSKRDALLGRISQSSASIEESKLESASFLPISFSVLVRASRAQTKNKTDAAELVLRKVKSLDLSNKEVTQIAQLSQCCSLQRLSLSNNLISSIQGLDQLKNLRILNLESNRIQTIEGLSELNTLEKLYLDGNFIKKIENLEGQQRLQELALSNQRINEPLSFDENSIVAISQSLRKLSVAGNMINDIGLLWYLDSVQILDLSNNNVGFSEDLYKVLSCMKSLTQLKLAGNPVSKRNKYRDEMVLWSHNLMELDDKDILANEKEYLFRLKGKRATNFVRDKNEQGIDLEVKGDKFNN
jgi:protein phosphatase 1 regulatory subunit 42